MASFFFAPDPLQSTFLIPGGNTPGNGAQVFIYSAGSTSKVTVYKDNLGNSAWANPIVLDSGGNLPSGGAVWIPSGVTIKAVWAPSNDTDPPGSPYRTIDNIAGINDTTGSQTDWIPGPTPTFVSGTQFTLAGDQTTLFKKSRNLKFTVTAGTVYGEITKSAFGALTTIDVAFASGALDSGLSAVSYSLIAPDTPSINADYINKQASTAASAGNGTTNIWGVAGNSLHVTGTNAIFSFSSAPYAGAQRDVIFDGALSLNSSGAIKMLGDLNVTTAANDRAMVYADTVSSSIITFYKQSGRPIVIAPADLPMTPITNSLGGDVNLTSTALYFDGPSVAQGTTGTWFASGTVTVNDASAAGYFAKLWDGTSTYASAAISLAAGANGIFTLSGTIPNPLGNIRISVRDASNATGKIIFNATGNSKDSTIIAMRVG